MTKSYSAAIAIALALGTSPAAAQTEIELLRQQLRAMEQRLAELEAQQNATQDQVEETAAQAEESARTIETEVVKSGGTLGTFILPGTDTRISFGGYVKGDFIYDVTGDIGSDDLFVASSIGVGVPDDNRFTAHARQSRFNVRTTTPSALGPVKTFFEGDFFGFGAPGTEVFTNSFSFRIRHLYGEVGPVGAGQFWTNFMPIEAYPRTVDFQGASGIPFIRQGQLRLTQPLTEKFTVIASLENSEFSGRAVDAGDVDGDGDVTELFSFGDTAPGALGGLDVGLDVAPDAVLAGVYRGDFGLLRGSVVGRRFGGQGSGDGTFGWGVNAAANVNLWEGAKGLASITYGDGVGRYLIDGAGLDGVVLANGDIETINALGATVQLQQQLTEDLTGAVAYGRYDVFEAFGPGDIDTLQTVHGSLFWSPVDRVTFGAEVIWGQRENANDASDSAFRVQSSLQVNF
ncbi:MAG: DcaP family trimeric outer membrane transporter [Pseudomonadota bacterium]